MKPIVPFVPVTSRNLDLDEVNGNLAAIAGNVNRNLRKRYTRPPPLIYPWDGITDASDASLRRFYIRRPAAGRAVEITGVELVLYGNAAVTATLSCSDTTWPDLTLATSATPTTEPSATSKNHVSVPSESADVTFTLSFSGAYTVTRGYLVVHLRCDRGNQGAAHTEWTPATFDSTSASAGTLGTLLNTEFSAAETAAGYDTANQDDLRCECIVFRSEAAAASAIVRLPGGAERTKVAATTYNLQAAGGTFTVDVDGDSDAVAGAGATTLAVSTNALTGTATDAPMTTASDTLVTLTVAAQTVQLGYVLLWWR